MNTWNILYRGSLSSCNYTCNYCPFAKTSNSRSELLQDAKDLERFVHWVSQQRRRIGILITPWGEALGHKYYREAMLALSHMTEVYRVAIQTNLSGPLDDFAGANRATLALWTTFHPSQTSVARFLNQCYQLDSFSIRYSVGIVGLREHFAAIEELRQRLRPEVYVWVNAFKRDPNYYRPGEIDGLREIDPYFAWNLQRYPSLGTPCWAGEATFTVDGAGDVRRCHFLESILGNIYSENFETCLRPRNCAAKTCGCHIGYVHRPTLELDKLFGDGLLERVPASWPRLDPYFVHGPEVVTAATRPHVDSMPALPRPLR